LEQDEEIGSVRRFPDCRESNMSTAAGLKNGQFNRIENLTKYNFIFLTGSTGLTG